MHSVYDHVYSEHYLRDQYIMQCPGDYAHDCPEIVLKKYDCSYMRQHIA